MELHLGAQTSGQTSDWFSAVSSWAQNVRNVQMSLCKSRKKQLPWEFTAKNGHCVSCFLHTRKQSSTFIQTRRSISSSVKWTVTYCMWERTIADVLMGFMCENGSRLADVIKSAGWTAKMVSGRNAQEKGKRDSWLWTVACLSQIPLSAINLFDYLQTFNLDYFFPMSF